jgi:hypothetical protein
MYTKPLFYFNKFNLYKIIVKVKFYEMYLIIYIYHIFFYIYNILALRKHFYLNYAYLKKNYIIE